MFEFDEKLEQLAERAEQKCKTQFEKIDKIAEINERKVLAAFIKNRVSEAHLKGTTGYGYDDIGREVLDKVYADIFGAEDALVRHNFVSGTHALSVALFGVLRTGDLMVSLTGKPYDTMEQVIGLSGEGNGSLKDFGVDYKQLDLIDGRVDKERIAETIKGAKVGYIQRSRGYSLRPSLTIDEIGEMVAIIKRENPNCIVIVDNCYGELVEEREPTEVGADLAVGSLIKNLGGGIAETGGYIAGRGDLVNLCAERLTCVGMGKEVGCTLNQTRPIALGVFLAASVVANAVKTSTFALALFDELGYMVYPNYDDKRTDIIVAIKLGEREKLISFCKGIQKGSPIDSFVSPEPWAMPGYDSEVIMAAGAFTMGASIELSADAPLREPYAVWLQGGITYNTGKLGVMCAAKELMDS